ncbi:hypothetical protein Tco_1087720 [Tanacetum coccineum]
MGKVIRFHGFLDLFPEVDAFIRIVTLIPMKFTEFVLVLVFHRTRHKRRGLEFHGIHFQDLFRVLMSAMNLSCLPPDLCRLLKSCFLSKLGLLAVS